MSQVSWVQRQCCREGKVLLPIFSGAFWKWTTNLKRQKTNAFPDSKIAAEKYKFLVCRRHPQCMTVLACQCETTHKCNVLYLTYNLGKRVIGHPDVPIEQLSLFEPSLVCVCVCFVESELFSVSTLQLSIESETGAEQSSFFRSPGLVLQKP